MGEHESCPIPSISVRELLADAAHPAQLELLCGREGLGNILNRTGVQKPENLNMEEKLEVIETANEDQFGIYGPEIDLFKIFMSDQNAETSAPAVSGMLVYILMATILALRPQGLFPPKGR